MPNKENGREREMVIDRARGWHYAPRHKAIISETEVWVGHILANYAIVFDGHGGSPPSGPLGAFLFVLL